MSNRSDHAQTPGTLPSLYEQHLPRLASTAAPLGVCRADDGLTRELVAELRSKDTAALAAFVLELVEASSPTQAIWDAFAVSCTEDLLRDDAGYALHRFDGMNALHHLWRRSADPLTRQLVMVQTAAYLCTIDARVRDTDVLTLDEIFEGVAVSPVTAAERVLGYLADGGALESVQPRAEAVTVRIAHRVDEHSYKFPVAVTEETEFASASWKPLVLAAIGDQSGRSPSTVGGPQWSHYEQAQAEIETL
ncbi:MAG: hypothetical protein JKY37_34960 [Nannocystaceae bacterium]|nr:hypothetical protein [Nannocystaceae bacterium]